MSASAESPASPAPERSWVRKVFVMAGMANIMTILIATRFFTDTLISEVDSSVFSKPSLVLVMVWGLAYLAIAPHWRRFPQMCLVFMLEKLVYVVMWTHWILERHDQLKPLWDLDWQIALFYGGYGIVDTAFSIFFFWAWTQARKHQEPSATPSQDSPDAE